jgi:hypothetical protein
MSEPAACKLSSHFANLINRDVDFVPARHPTENTPKQVYGVYTVYPQMSALVVKADLTLLGSLAGALVGLPNDEVQFRMQSAESDDLLGDAMREVFNVAASVVTSEGRAVFKSMLTEKIYLRPEAERTLSAPLHRSSFNVEIEGYEGGRFSVFE